MSARRHLPRLVERLLRIERRVRRVYVKLARRAEFPIELRELWSALAEDENTHRAVLEHSSGLLNFVPSLPPISEAKLKSVKEQVTAVEAAVQQPRLSIDEALGHALRLENSELTEIVDAWERAFSSHLSKLTRTEPPNEKNHVQRLNAAVHAFSTNQELHRQATTMVFRYD